MTNQDSPTVGIGLPVYNNSKHLSKTLDSLINQTYSNIFIYLSDDCSNDGTDAICELYAEKDKRIQYSRNEINVGPYENHKKVLSLSTTDYFMFSRGHEILSLNLIEECVRVMEEDRSLAFAFARTVWIDEKDNIIPNKPIGYIDTRGFDVVTRCALGLWNNPNCFYGLARSEAIKSIRIFVQSMGSDQIMLFEMALIGAFAHVPSTTRYRRYIYSEETFRKRVEKYKTITFKKLNIIERIWPYARTPFELILSLKKSNISIKNKILILFVILFNSPLRYLVSVGKQL